MDFNDTEALASLFTEDGILQISKGQLRGRAAILKSTKERTKEGKDRVAKDTSGMGRSPWGRTWDYWIDK